METLTKLISGDCLKEMRKMDDNIIDLTVTSPPYDDLRPYKGNLKWGKDVWEPVLDQLYRITKKGGCVVWVVGDASVKGGETGTSFKQALYAIDRGFRLHDTMIYQKHGMPTDPRIRYYQRFEYMFVFSKGKPNTFSPISDVKSSGRKQRNGSDRRGDNLICTKRQYQTPEFSVRGNVWTYNPRNMRTGHPASFPEDLARDHIISWSKEGDIIFDPFMGSGTTGKVALENNRNFIGIEIVDEYFDIALERIKGSTEWKH